MTLTLNNRTYSVIPRNGAFILQPTYTLPNGKEPRFATVKAAQLFAAGVWPFPVIAL
jgi:hypothetical protein